MKKRILHNPFLPYVTLPLILGGFLFAAGCGNDDANRTHDIEQPTYLNPTKPEDCFIGTAVEMGCVGVLCERYPTIPECGGVK